MSRWGPLENEMLQYTQDFHTEMCPFCFSWNEDSINNMWFLSRSYQALILVVFLLFPLVLAIERKKKFIMKGTAWKSLRTAASLLLFLLPPWIKVNKMAVNQFCKANTPLCKHVLNIWFPAIDGCLLESSATQEGSERLILFLAPLFFFCSPLSLPRRPAPRAPLCSRP